MGGINIVVIGAHPDDYEIGVGMLILENINKGNKVYGIVCSDGEAQKKTKGISTLRRKEAEGAAEMMGLSDVFFLGYPDRELRKHNNKILDDLESIFLKADPLAVYTHAELDRHQDHVTVSRAVKCAARRIPSVFEYYSISTLVDVAFHDFFIGTKDLMDKKLDVLSSCYKSQLDGVVNCDKLKAQAIYFGTLADLYNKDVVFAEPIKSNHAVHYIAR